MDFRQSFTGSALSNFVTLTVDQLFLNKKKSERYYKTFTLKNKILINLILQIGENFISLWSLLIMHFSQMKKEIVNKKKFYTIPCINNSSNHWRGRVSSKITSKYWSILFQHITGQQLLILCCKKSSFQSWKSVFSIFFETDSVPSNST